MKLIEQYVTEVGKHLPRKIRLDIETELRSTLEDMLEDRKASGNTISEEELTKDILREYGSPHKAAELYQTHSYLIGPGMFSTYKRVLKIVLTVITILLLMVSVIGTIGADTSSGGMLNTAIEILLRLIGGAFGAFTYVTLIFAILERVLPDGEFEDLKDWNPEELSKVPDVDKISISEQIFSIFFIIAGLYLLNFFPGVYSTTLFSLGEWTKLASFSDDFLSLLPWINLAGLLTVILNIILLRQRYWQMSTRWAYIGTRIISIGIVNALMRMPNLLKFSDAFAIPEAATNGLAILFSLVVPMVFTIILIISIIEIVKTAWILFKMNSMPIVIKKEV